jgi:hypothetical protein
MNAAIGKLLTQFDANGRVKPAEKPKAAVVTAPPPKEPPPKAIKQEPPAAPKAGEIPANVLDGAYRRGYAAAISEAEGKLAEERIRGAVRLGEERAKWSDQQAVALANGFSAACRELETNIANSVARILQPFLSEAIRDKAVAAMVEQIAALTNSASRPAFHVSGPRELIELVKAQLDGQRQIGIEYQVVSGAGEIRVVADQTVIETQMSAWVERLKEARW